MSNVSQEQVLLEIPEDLILKCPEQTKLDALERIEEIMIEDDLTLEDLLKAGLPLLTPLHESFDRPLLNSTMGFRFTHFAYPGFVYTPKITLRIS